MLILKKVLQRDAKQIQQYTASSRGQSWTSRRSYVLWPHRDCLSMLSTLSSSQREFSSSICSWISNSSSGDRFPWATNWFPACRTLPTLLWCAVSSIIKPWKWYKQTRLWGPIRVYDLVNILKTYNVWISALEGAATIKWMTIAERSFPWHKIFHALQKFWIQ